MRSSGTLSRSTPERCWMRFRKSPQFQEATSRLWHEGTKPMKSHATAADSLCFSANLISCHGPLAGPFTVASFNMDVGPADLLFDHAFHSLQQLLLSIGYVNRRFVGKSAIELFDEFVSRIP